jgi:hypothetical protein
VGAITTGDLSWEELANRRGFMERKKRKGQEREGAAEELLGIVAK